MAKLSVHPHIGYLNTEFSIQSFSKEKRMVHIYPIDNVVSNKPIISCLLLNGKTLQENYVFKFPGRYVVMLLDDKDSAIEIEVKDAIKFGGSTHKSSYVFEETPWCFVVMKDRTYFYNRDTHEQYVENISPDKIACVSKNVVLLSNDTHNEKTLYSLAEQTPIVTFDNDILLKNDILIIESEIDGLTKLIVYHFGDIIYDKNEYECENFMVYEEYKLLFIYRNQKIYVISLDSFEIIKSISHNNEFVKFTNKHYFVELEQKRSYTIISVKDILSDQSWCMHFVYPISVCEGVNLNDIQVEENKVNQLFDLAYELDLFNTEKAQLLGGIDISYRYCEIQGFYVLSNQLYYLVTEYSYTINRFFSKCRKSNTYLRIPNDDFNLEINDSYSKVELLNDCLFVENYNHVFVIKDKELVFNKNATVYRFKNTIILSSKYDNSDEEIYGICDGKIRPVLKGKFKWNFFAEYGILEQKDSEILYAISPRDIFSIQKLDIENSSHCTLVEFPQDKILKYGDNVLYYHGIMLCDQKIILPENMTALSEKQNYAISIYGSHVFLGRISRSHNCFVNEQILESLFDSSSYGNVLMSDDGENIIYQKDKEMFLMNTVTKEVQNFPNQSFISQINGYRPLFKVDDSHRCPRVINPLTREYIDQDYIINYGFVSPDGKLYAESALDKYVKYYDKVNKIFISKEKWMTLAEKYDYEWNINADTKNAKEESRKNFINKHYEFFRDNELDDLLKVTSFRDIIADELGYAIIRKVRTDDIYCEIELGAKLWFLNYVSFSYDSRYVAIAGRYPNNTEINGHVVCGLFLVYDMINHQAITNNTTSYAVWTAAFTKFGYYAAYDSYPTLLWGNICEAEDLKEIRNRNFLAFSPDGEYMALSKQGYVPYSADNANWGHQPSTSIYIHAIDSPNEQIIPTIDDLSDAGIADTVKAQSVSSCSFSLDNKKLMMVGNDGTVVIRNLHLN